ncbi:MAG: GIY-YIG nuclease family protein [Aeromicrobium sp.]|uniref:GIY-YIG nuclease family protein n=1 Tax=Aeromicrobium sp. TaxID=1871063 RepID=UPI003C5B56D3
MAFMYILLCADGTFYTGSTRDVLHRLGQHERGDGAEYTKRRRPVTLVYFEEFDRIDHAFLREKQVQGWTHGRKRMLVRDGRGVRPGST